MLKAEKKDFGFSSDIELDFLDRSGNLKPIHKVFYNSYYALHLSKWYKTFPARQIHIVNGDRLISHPWEEAEKIETFLGIQHVLTKDREGGGRKRQIEGISITSAMSTACRL